MRPTLSVLIVAFHSREQLARTLPALLPELGEGDELIVVENAPGDGSAELVRQLAPAARLVETGGNVGFAAGCNAGAARARGELLVILNPDAAPLPGWGEAIRRPWSQGRGWAAPSRAGVFRAWRSTRHRPGSGPRSPRPGRTGRSRRRACKAARRS